MKFFVYCNIRKKTLSMKALEGPFRGKVVASVEQLLLKDVEFRVSEAGRQRARKTRRKNVHAGVVGTAAALWGAEIREDLDPVTFQALGAGKPWPAFRGARLYYNPYQTKTFVRCRDGLLVSRAKFVKLDRCGIRATGVN